MNGSFVAWFRDVYLVLFAVVVVVRKYFTSRYRKEGMAVSRKSVTDFLLLALNGIGMTIPLVHLFSSRLDFADYAMPSWTVVSGALLFAVLLLFLW